jgi:hypothetical protein
MNRFMLPPRRNPMLQCRKYLRLGNLRVFTQARPTGDVQQRRENIRKQSSNGQRTMAGLPFVGDLVKL